MRQTWIWINFAGVLLFSFGCRNHPPPNAKAEQALNALRTACLVGRQVELRLAANGELIFSLPRPSGRLDVTISRKEAEGGVNYVDEKIREAVDKETRDCMKPYIGRIIDAILSNQSAVEPTDGNGAFAGKPVFFTQGTTSYYFDNPSAREKLLSNDIPDSDRVLLALASVRSFHRGNPTESYDFLPTFVIAKVVGIGETQVEFLLHRLGSDNVFRSRDGQYSIHTKGMEELRKKNLI